MVYVKLDPLKDLMKSYGMKPLAEQAGVSRTSLYNLSHGENFESETLEKVARVLNIEFGFLNKTPAFEETCNHLAFYGAPLAYDKNAPHSMGFEETLKWGLHYSLTDGMLESLMPYLLLKYSKKINLNKLLSRLDQQDYFQLFGYYLELAAEFSKTKNLQILANTFYSENFNTLYLGHEKPSERVLKAVKERKNKSADKWNVFTLNSTENYFERFIKWDQIV